MDPRRGLGMKALVVHPDGTTHLLFHTGTLEEMRGAIGGGWLEGIQPSLSSPWHAYCDEEGKFKGLPLNLPATALANALGWQDDILAGTVVFCGHTADGDEDDVPDSVLELAGVEV